jgi:AraC-like DNA-binding protein
MSEPTFNVDRLAEMMNIGRTKFYGKVKELTGMSPNKYLQEARMRRASELLLEGEYSVSEVSFKVGIQDASYFNKMFKTHFGVVPSKYGR